MALQIGPGPPDRSRLSPRTRRSGSDGALRTGTGPLDWTWLSCRTRPSRLGPALRIGPGPPDRTWLSRRTWPSRLDPALRIGPGWTRRSGSDRALRIGPGPPDRTRPPDCRGLSPALRLWGTWSSPPCGSTAAFPVGSVVTVEDPQSLLISSAICAFYLCQKD